MLPPAMHLNLGYSTVLLICNVGSLQKPWHSAFMGCCLYLIMHYIMHIDVYVIYLNVFHTVKLFVLGFVCFFYQKKERERCASWAIKDWKPATFLPLIVGSLYLVLHISGMHKDSGRKKTILAPLQRRCKDLLNCVKVLFSGCCPRTDEISPDLISTMPIGLRKISVWETAKHSKHFTSNTCACACVCAAEDDKDHYVEELEVTPCETRAEEPFLLQKPVTRARLEARTESLQRTDSLQVRRPVQPTAAVTHVGAAGCGVATDSFRGKCVLAGKDSGRLLRAVFPRWEETHRLHPGVQEVQYTGGEEEHLREEPAGWGSDAGEGGKISNGFSLKGLMLYRFSGLYFSLQKSSCTWLFIQKT